MQVVAADSVQDNVPPSYAVYMFDPGPQTWLIVAAPPKGFMYTDPVSIEARPEPNATDPTSVDPALAAQNLALIEVRSVYDTDGLNRMGEGMLAAVDLPPGCSVGIATTRPTGRARHTRAGRRPGAHEGPGRQRLRLRAGALRARHARGGAAVEHDGPALGHRRDRVRAAADPRLRADRARRLVQAAGAGRRAAGAGGRRCQGPRHPDAPELDPGAPGRTPHLRRLPQPAARRRHQLRRGRQHPAGGTASPACQASTGPARPWPRCAPAWMRRCCA